MISNDEENTKGSNGDAYHADGQDPEWPGAMGLREFDLNRPTQAKAAHPDVILEEDRQPTTPVTELL